MTANTLTAEQQRMLDENINPFDREPNGPGVRTYKTRQGALRVKPSMELIEELDADGEGFCIACGNTQPAEPDARNYVCDCCGVAKVYGAAELVLMGLVF